MIFGFKKKAGKAEASTSVSPAEVKKEAVKVGKTTLPAPFVLTGGNRPHWESVLCGRVKERTGIEISVAEINPRAVSHYAVMTEAGAVCVPFLTLFTFGGSFSDAIREPEGSGLAKDEVAAAVRDIWRGICGEFTLDAAELYDDRMYIGVQKTETVCFEYFARTQKNAVREYVIRETGREPQSIYASSLPSLTIVFSHEDYEAADIGLKAQALADGIRALAAAFVRDKSGLELENTLKVAFMHPEMSGYNGYGLSRED